MTRELRQRFFPLVLRDRPPVLTLSTPAALLEAFTQVLLGRDPEVWRDQEREHTSGWEWLQRSVTHARQGHGSVAHTLYASLLQSAAHKDTAPVAPACCGDNSCRRHRAGVQSTWRPCHRRLYPRHGAGGKTKEQVRRVDLDRQDIDDDVLSIPSKRWKLPKSSAA